MPLRYIEKDEQGIAMNIFLLLIELFSGTMMNVVSLFFRLKKNQIIITSTFNNAFNFNSKYFFEYCIAHTHFNVRYVIKDAVLRNKLNQQYGDYFISPCSIKGLRSIMTAKVWVSSTFELPLLSLFKRPGRIVLHLGHGVPLKNIGLREKEISLIKSINRRMRVLQFTDVVCYSGMFRQYFIEAFASKNKNYVYLGQPRNDVLGMEKRSARQNLNKFLPSEITGENVKYILYAPTWRPYSETMLFPFIGDEADHFYAFLRDNNIVIMVRTHPFYPAMMPDNVSYNENIISLGTDKVAEICDVLPAFDGLITDYSSIYIDFLNIGPVAFSAYDLEEYKQKVGFSFEYEELTPGMKIFSLEDIKTFIHDLQRDPCEEQRLSFAKKTNTKYKGNSAEIMNYLQLRINA